MRIPCEARVGAMCLFLLLGGAVAGPAAERPAALRLPLKVETLPPAAGATLPSWDTLELQPGAAGRYDVRLSPGADAPRFETWTSRCSCLAFPRWPAETRR